eukprot:174576_1
MLTNRLTSIPKQQRQINNLLPNENVNPEILEITRHQPSESINGRSICTDCVICQKIMLQSTSNCIITSIAKNLVIGYLRNVERMSNKNIPTELVMLIAE